MKIAFIHKFFHKVGGTEQYFEDLQSILRANGHETIPFSLKSPKNPPTDYEKYFLEPLDYRSGSPLTKLPRILSRTLYSFEAKRKLSRLIADEKPDLAHLQLIDHHISPSVLHTLRDHRIPIVQTVGNYKHVCASYRLYRFDQRAVCELCLGGNHTHAFRTRCLKGSLTMSALAAFEMYLHGWMKIYRHVDRFVVPNEFMRQKLLGAGYAERKIAKLRNPLDLGAYSPSYELGASILYFGRFDPEKGLDTLLDAMELLPEFKLKMIGEGQVGDGLRARAATMQNVEILPPQWGEALMPHLASARLVVLPSIWYEISPMVIYQAFAMGKAVVASDIGGIPDLLTEETGKLFVPGSSEDLAAKLSDIVGSDAMLDAMGRAARRWAEQHLDPDNYYRAIMAVYAGAKEEAA